jgi:hypothetical protein
MIERDVSKMILPEVPLLNSQRTFINELTSLKQDRYIEVFAHYGRTFWLVKLKHLTNGRTLILRCYAQWGSLEEKGKCLKCWPTGFIPY